MEEKRKIDVQIDGRNFTIVGVGSKQHIHRIAAYVDDIIKEVSSKNNNLSQIMTATLAALHISDELSKKQIEFDELSIKAKEPLDKYDGVCEELKESKDKIEILNNMAEHYQRQITSYDKKIQEMEFVLDGLNKTIADQKDELSNRDETIESLKDKNYRNQLDIVDLKKELTEYVRILDRDTRS